MTSESRSDPAADARRLDAAYRRIPNIDALSSASVDNALWSERVESLNARKASASREHMEHAVSALLRMAAMDTGAIEGGRRSYSRPPRA